MTQDLAKVAGAGDVDRIVAVLALAFSADPINRWIFPDPHQFWTHFPRVLRAFGSQSFERGTAYYCEGYRGAALWLPPDRAPDEAEVGAVMEEAVDETIQEEVFALMEQMGHNQPTEPHWYLPIIGVDPAWQGRGYGSTLLAYALAHCDAEHTLAYLESSNESNISFYERHGFEVIATIQVGSSPTMWPMVRRPR